jgi:hypothetical protein
MVTGGGPAVAPALEASLAINARSATIKQVANPTKRAGREAARAAHEEATHSIVPFTDTEAAIAAVEHRLTAILILFPFYDFGGLRRSAL